MRESAVAILGLIVASAVPPAILALTAPLGGELSVGSAVATFEVTYPFSAAAVIVLGLPAFFLLRPFAPGQWWSVFTVGFLLGIVVAIILRLPNLPDPHDFIELGPIGAASALSFWRIWLLASKPSVARGD